MKHLLVGNGINIQYGGLEYANTSIIDRAMDNAKNGCYEPGMKRTIAPEELLRFFKLLQVTLKEMLQGKYVIFVSI